MPKNWFRTENFVIITSNIEIDSLQWQKHFQNNWNQLIRPNTKVLVLAGIHGCKDGTLGFVDEGLLKEYEHQIQFLKRRNKEDLEDKKAQFILENVGSHMNEGKFSENTFIKVVKEHNPTVITIAFCYTTVSVIHDILRSSGIYTLMIMSKDRADITEDKCMSLDSTQKQIIKTVAEVQPKNVFLWGSSGTGKTIVLAEVLKIKISHYKKEHIKLNIFVTSYMAATGSQLMEDFKEKYLAYLPSECQVQFIPFNLLCRGKLCVFDDCYLKIINTIFLYFEELGIQFDNIHPQTTINSVIKTITNKYPEFHNIILIDEVVSVNEVSTAKSLCIWSNIDTKTTNVDFLIALNPQGIKFKKKFRVIPPKNKNTVSKQLIYKHRNSFECDSIVEHFKSLPNTSYLDTCNDLKAEHSSLPTGRIPLWIEEIIEIPIEIIFECIKNYLIGQESVTLIYNIHGLRNERRQTVEQHCVKSGWSFKHYSHFFGCEDQVIILFECSLLFELISRGRNQVIFITNNK